MARNERKDEPEREAEKKPSPRDVHREHAGSKPRLTDEQAHAELRRRQRERAR